MPPPRGRAADDAGSAHAPSLLLLRARLMPLPTAQNVPRLVDFGVGGIDLEPQGPQRLLTGHRRLRRQCDFPAFAFRASFIADLPLGVGLALIASLAGLAGLAFACTRLSPQSQAQLLSAKALGRF